MNQETSRPKPDVSISNSLLGPLAKQLPKLAVRVAETGMFKSVVINEERAAFNEPTSFSQSAEMVFQESNFIEYFAAFLGAYLSTKAISSKEELGVDPDKPLLKFIWSRAVEVQVTAIFWAVARTLSSGVIGGATGVLENSAVTLSAAAGVATVIDNMFVHTGKRESAHLKVPTAIMVIGILSFVFAPAESKPALAGFTVAAIANFIESATEVIDDLQWSDLRRKKEPENSPVIETPQSEEMPEGDDSEGNQNSSSENNPNFSEFSAEYLLFGLSVFLNQKFSTGIFAKQWSWIVQKKNDRSRRKSN